MRAILTHTPYCFAMSHIANVSNAHAFSVIKGLANTVGTIVLKSLENGTFVPRLLEDKQSSMNNDQKLSILIKKTGNHFYWISK